MDYNLEWYNDQKQQVILQNNLGKKNYYRFSHSIKNRLETAAKQGDNVFTKDDTLADMVVEVYTRMDRRLLPTQSPAQQPNA